MPTRPEMETEAESRILAQIEIHLPPIRDRMAALEPLEAYALVGILMTDTISRFPLAQRVKLAIALATTFVEGVREGCRRIEVDEIASNRRRH